MAETYVCSKPQFLRDIADHKMLIERDNGIYRHLKFRNRGCSGYWFDIITWPGTLCINGDMGCHVFSRLPDMFEFFRNDCGDINLTYWSEKLVSCQRADVKVHSADMFTYNIVYYVRQRFVGRDKAGQTELFKAIREEVLCHADDAHASYEAAYHFQHELPDSQKFVFRDFWEYDNTEYTVHFTWCLRAILWAIEQYNAAKIAVPASSMETAHG